MTAHSLTWGALLLAARCAAGEVGAGCGARSAGPGLQPPRTGGRGAPVLLARAWGTDEGSGVCEPPAMGVEGLRVGVTHLSPAWHGLWRAVRHRAGRRPGGVGSAVAVPPPPHSPVCSWTTSSTRSRHRPLQAEGEVRVEGTVLTTYPLPQGTTSPALMRGPHFSHKSQFWELLLPWPWDFPLHTPSSPQIPLAAQVMQPSSVSPSSPSHWKPQTPQADLVVGDLLQFPGQPQPWEPPLNPQNRPGGGNPLCAPRNSGHGNPQIHSFLQ